MHQDIQRALSGMPVAAPTRTDLYEGTRRMGQGANQAGPTNAIPAYRYGPDDQPPPGNRHRKWIWVAVVAAVLLVLGLGGYALNYAAGGGGKISVPSVVGLTRKAAEKKITKAKLEPVVVLQASSTTPRGKVISTSPTFGTLVAANSQVKLFVSTGPAKKPVPDVVGEQELTAENKLQNAGFKVAPPKTDPTSSKPQGTVISQSPAGNSLARAGSTVSIVVSGGGVRVPNVVGDSVQEAVQKLTAANLSYKISRIGGPARRGRRPGGRGCQQTAAAGPVGGQEGLHRSGATAQALTLLVVCPATRVTFRCQVPTVREPLAAAFPAGRVHPSGATTLTLRGPHGCALLRRCACPGGKTDQETTVPKSRVRSKAVYTPPPRSAKAQVSPRWLVPTMLGSLLVGLAWISLFYITGGTNPAQSAIGSWNLVVGFGFIIGGVVLATKWR